MDQITLPGIDIAVRRSSRARRLSLRVSSLDGRVTMTVPSFVSEREARAFASQKSGWIAKAVARCHAPVSILPGAEVPIEGAFYQVHTGAGRIAQLDGTKLFLPKGREAPALTAYLKLLARDRFVERVKKHANVLGRRFGRITLRDTRSRWGSCSSEGNLMFSWRLVMATPDVLDYVAAHEVAHLERMDHSPSFWRIVEELCPEHKVHRKWLRQDGNSLHRYQFG